MATAPPGYLTINQAARELGETPWRVMELVRSGDLAALIYVEADSLRKKESA